MIEFDSSYLKDFGPIGEATLPLRRQGAVLICGDNRDTTAADSNGAGKTHLFKGLSWTLFGDNIEGDKTDEVIRRGCKRAIGRVRFAIDGAMHEVERSRSKGVVTLALRRDKGGGSMLDISGPVVKETQAKITDLLGLDFLTFKNTVLFGQGDTAHFASPLVTDADRKTILKRVLRLEVMDRALKVVATKNTAKAKATSAARNQLGILEAKLSGYDIGAIQERLRSLRMDRVAIANEEAKRGKVNRLIGGITTQLKQYEGLAGKISKLRAAESEALTAATKAMSDITRLEGEVARLKRSRAMFDAGRCPTCGTPADSDHIKDHIGELDAEIAATATALTEARSAHKEALEARKAAQGGVKECDAEAAEERDWQNRLSELRGIIKGLDGVEARLKGHDAQIKRTTDELENAKNGKTSLESDIAALKVEIATAEEEMRHLDFWVKGFGNTGLPSFIMDAVVPTLTERANKYLDILSDGDIKVRFDTESALKSGEIRDRFAVIPDIEGTGDTRPSGGQLRKLLLATDLALMSYVADRERAAIDLLLMDEVLDGLDASGKARVIDLLMELRKTRSSIFVISHDPALAEMFERRFTVVKDGAVSRLELA